MAEYENPGDRTYYKEGKTEVKFGKRVFGGANWSGLESCGEQRMGSENHFLGPVYKEVG